MTPAPQAIIHHANHTPQTPQASKLFAIPSHPQSPPRDPRDSAFTSQRKNPIYPLPHCPKIGLNLFWSQTSWRSAQGPLVKTPSEGVLIPLRYNRVSLRIVIERRHNIRQYYQRVVGMVFPFASPHALRHAMRLLMVSFLTLS